MFLNIPPSSLLKAYYRMGEQGEKSQKLHFREINTKCVNTVKFSKTCKYGQKQQKIAGPEQEAVWVRWRITSVAELHTVTSKSSEEPIPPGVGNGRSRAEKHPGLCWRWEKETQNRFRRPWAADPSQKPGEHLGKRCLCILGLMKWLGWHQGWSRKPSYTRLGAERQRRKETVPSGQHSTAERMEPLSRETGTSLSLHCNLLPGKSNSFH